VFRVRRAVRPPGDAARRPADGCVLHIDAVLACPP
jgi:hypothetical protein